MAPTLDRIDHVHVFVADRAAAERWYERVLGFSPVAALAFWSHGGGPSTISDGSGRIHLALFERPTQACRSTVAFGATAEAFLAWREHLCAALGHPVDVTDHQVSWSMYFSDPDGNPFEITCDDHGVLSAALGEGQDR